ncbi:hypothetical protein EV207_13227 [Scopulibacillus darangshiensis]|uniref:Uncharacterized protein n=1 Tax=Scopulibacillus darangshiensis TaxID=442528 RepID=A0A4R2NPY7_9BACL|nr:hypothetical protein [Scopulibacillus darangshiensis]TCP23428.1 hypothetical protein EV207_13227 [Scopulibacillus darangshiensis]
MGLDMYLYSFPKLEGVDFWESMKVDTYRWQLEKKDNILYQKVAKHLEESGMSWDDVQRQDVAYWRKANQIHNWFVENLQDSVDNCSISEVKRSHIILLNNYCRMILESSAKAEDVLPTTPGFYFGSTTYDSFYYSEIYETHTLLAFLIQNFSFDKNYLFYQSSW